MASVGSAKALLMVGAADRGPRAPSITALWRASESAGAASAAFETAHRRRARCRRRTHRPPISPLPLGDDLYRCGFPFAAEHLRRPSDATAAAIAPASPEFQPSISRRHTSLTDSSMLVR